VELEVLDALRGVSISAKRWRAALVTLEKTARKLELAEEAVRLGKLGFSEFNILQFQDELTAARLSVNQNYADYLRSRTAPLRAEGRILSARGLTAE
jgi:outer membrane protein TolC